MEDMLTVRNLRKTFRIYRRPVDRLAEFLGRGQRHREFTALDGVSFSLGRGETVGIVGENGSGKSTLLKIIAGVLFPDGGDIVRHGRIAGLLELGTGFNAELSGAQNILLNGAYLGLTRAQVRERTARIIAFSELEHCIHEPLKSYSSGMTMRLAFAIAVHADPQCFLIDEALSVGDVYFQQKCFRRMREFRDAGGSVLFVSHDLNAVKLLCDRVLLLHNGVLRGVGAPDDMVNAYNQLMAAKADAGQGTAVGCGYGDSAVRIEGARVLDAQGASVTTVCSGDPAKVIFSWTAREDVSGVSFGVLLRDRFGQDVFGTNGALLGRLADLRAGRRGTATFDIAALNLGPGLYTVTLAAHTGDNHLQRCFHWIDNAAHFEVVQRADYLFSGHTRLTARLRVDDAPSH